MSEPWPLSDIVFGEGEVVGREIDLHLVEGSLIDGIPTARVRLRPRYTSHDVDEASTPDGIIVNGETQDERRFQFTAGLWAIEGQGI